MSLIEVTVAVVCDYPSCRIRTDQISGDFVPYPMEAGWQRWRGSRRTMDYCPTHAGGPKSKNMRLLWAAEAGQ